MLSALKCFLSFSRYKNRKRCVALTILKQYYITSLVSFFTVLSTEMILNILPLFTMSIGGTPLFLGIIAGTSSLALYFLYSIWNWLNTKFHSQKYKVLFGSVLSNLSKPIICFSPSWVYVLGLKSSENFGNNLRSCSCDEFMACNPEVNNSRRLDKILESLGFFIGSFLAFFFLFIHWSYSQIILISIIPGFIAILLIILMKSDDINFKSLKDLVENESKQNKTQLKKRFLVIFILEFASIDALFLVIRVFHFVPGDVVLLIPIFFLFSNFTYLIFSNYTRKLEFLKEQKTFIIIGLSIIILVYVLLVFPFEFSFPSVMLIIIIFLTYGLFKALITPISTNLINDVNLKIKGGKKFNSSLFIIGVVIFFKSIIFGLVYYLISFSAIFFISFIITIASLVFISTTKVCSED